MRYEPLMAKKRPGSASGVGRRKDGMLYVEKTLGKDERVLYVAQYHWIYTARALLSLILLWWVLGLGIYLFFSKMIRKWTTHIVITNKRFVRQTGWTNHQVLEVGLERIFGCKVNQDAWARLLGYGKVTVSAAAIGEIHLPRFLKDPLGLRMVLIGGEAAEPAAAMQPCSPAEMELLEPYQAPQRPALPSPEPPRGSNRLKLPGRRRQERR